MTELKNLEIFLVKLFNSMTFVLYHLCLKKRFSMNINLTQTLI